MPVRELVVDYASTQTGVGYHLLADAFEVPSQQIELPLM